MPDSDPRHVPVLADRPVWRYRMLARLLAPVMRLHAWHRARRDGGTRYRRQRLGHDYPAVTAPRWIHAASVGEVVTVWPLLQALLEREDPDILVTTTTPTGAEVLQRRIDAAKDAAKNAFTDATLDAAVDSGGAAGKALPARARIHHAYLPIDTPGATARFLDATQPVSAWIVETELWPWLYARCHAHGVPLTIVNGRLSSRTRRAAEGFLGLAYARALTGVTVLARTDDDAAAFVAMGASPAAVSVPGNLKLAGAAFADGSTASLTDTARRVTPPYCLAASTHEDEERQLAREWLSQREDGLLVIVPRHPERGPAIAVAIDEECAPVALTPCRSRGDSITLDARLYIADTLGELDAWYAHADSVFVGGSLIARGGHNLLEPARHGCAILTGPYMHNFEDVMTLLAAENAVITVQSAAEAVRLLTELQRSPSKRASLSEGCRRALVQGESVREAYAARLGIDVE